MQSLIHTTITTTDHSISIDEPSSPRWSDCSPVDPAPRLAALSSLITSLSSSLTSLTTLCTRQHHDLQAAQDRELKYKMVVEKHKQLVKYVKEKKKQQ